MITKREKTAVIEDLEAGREERIYTDVIATDRRIEEIENDNAEVYVSTKGIRVDYFLRSLTFKNATELREYSEDLFTRIYRS